MRKSTRLGFKLIELLVVIAILAIGAMLMFPAVQQVRDGSSASTQTKNNLRQCAIAIHNYHGTYSRLPNAAWTGGIYTSKESQRSMWFHRLPFIEADNVYKNNVHDAVVSAYLAPSDPYVSTTDGKVNFAGNIRLFGYGTLTATNANSAVVPATGEPSGLSLETHLAAAMSSGLTLARISDGTENVIMLTTRYADCGSPNQSTYYSGSPIGTVLADGGTPPSTGAPHMPVKGGFFGAGSHDRPADNTSPGAMFQTAPKGPLDCRPDDSVFGHSFSGDGLYVALADASIKTIAPTMSPKIFCRALCPGDGWRVDWPDD
jgi:prepilin-type N-terminal cleavage/methylation domain-containing protein